MRRPVDAVRCESHPARPLAALSPGGSLRLRRSCIEAEPPTSGPRSAYWNELSEWVPTTLLVRARKQGI